MKRFSRFQQLFLFSFIFAVSLLCFGTTLAVSGGTYLENTRLRETPSLKGNILSVVPAYTTVLITEEKGEWYKVKLNNGSVGWSMKIYVRSETVKEKNKKKVVLQGEVPVGVNLGELNQYWLEKINALREKKSLRLLVLDQRWIDTATEWAAYMGRLGSATHTRPDGKSMHKWIDTKGLDFTLRNSKNGWKKNYFTENIAWGIASPTTADVKRVLDTTMTFFLGEASYNGDHYRTLYHPDWNSVGVGFSFKDQGNGKYKVFIAMHYGSLQN